jgi:hypothetical protein
MSFDYHNPNPEFHRSSNDGNITFENYSSAGSGKGPKFSGKGGPLHARLIQSQTTYDPTYKIPPGAPSRNHSNSRRQLSNSSYKKPSLPPKPYEENSVFTEIKNKRQSLDSLRAERDQLIEIKRNVSKNLASCWTQLDYEDELLGKKAAENNVSLRQNPQDLATIPKNGFPVEKCYDLGGGLISDRIIDIEQYKQEILNLANYIQEKNDHLKMYDSACDDLENRVLELQRKGRKLKSVYDELESSVTLRKNQKERLGFYLKYNTDYWSNNERFNSLNIELRRRLLDFVSRSSPDDEYLANLPENELERVVFHYPEVRIIGGYLLSSTLKKVWLRHASHLIEVCQRGSVEFYQARDKTAGMILEGTLLSGAQRSYRTFFNILKRSMGEYYQPARVNSAYRLGRLFRAWKDRFMDGKINKLNIMIFVSKLESLMIRESNLQKFLVWKALNLQNWRRERVEILVTNSFENFKRKLGVRFEMLVAFSRRVGKLKTFYMTIENS